ncbi:hypothetical protein VPBG_00191 [Vibrio phage helene 12B3]|uniref:hypothetical protein n=1 Tax=Vibrio phage helene 12B3 TaxID=573173 RepID=UPI0002C07C5F|nr:hypothetical protein VPBG_00191 [Vibrio phage helene 12B3]AGG57963.1 hypothetical protein VPBG_00191 [Vibrio phage helene 12B3]
MDNISNIEKAYTLYCVFTNHGNPDATCYSFYAFSQEQEDLRDKWLAVVGLVWKEV